MRPTMRTATILLMVLALLAIAAVAITCPEDDSGAYFTGKTRVSSAGKLLKQYKCNSYGHLFWVKA